MCLESCFECQEPCWPIEFAPMTPGIEGYTEPDEVVSKLFPAAPPAAGYPCHSGTERSDDAQPAGPTLQDIPNYEKRWCAVGD